MSRRGGKRSQLREVRTRSGPNGFAPLVGRLFCWPTVFGAVFVGGAVAIVLMGEMATDFAVGQRIDSPVYAKVGFQVLDPVRTSADRQAARAKTPSHYTLNTPALTFDRIRADLMRLYQAAVDADAYEAFESAMQELTWPADRNAYNRLRTLVDLADDTGRVQLQSWVAKLPLESQYVVRNLARENREPASLADYILLETPGADDDVPIVTQIPHAELVAQGNDRALQGIANYVARRLPAYELRPVVEAIVLAAYREQPTVVFEQTRTVEAMQAAEEATPEAMTTYEVGKAFVNPGVLDTKGAALMTAHHGAVLDFLRRSTPEASKLRRERALQRVGLVTLVVLLTTGLLAYTRVYEKNLLLSRTRATAFITLLLGTMLACWAIDLRWPHYPELLVIPILMAASILGIVYPRRFAIGVMSMVTILVLIVIRGQMTVLLTLLTGIAVAVYQLDEIRHRTKLIRVGLLTAAAIMTASGAGSLLDGRTPELVLQSALYSGGCALAAAFFVSGLLPFVERLFQTATSLTLLEWRDPTRPLLQLLAREAPGTYNHSLVLGTLAEAACGRIGADGLLAQVGALYHDIGKIHRPAYFAENQEGRISRHENLSPTMSLLVILGHVKDGLEMARQYKLPRTLHQFIGEHHGTTVVRYFHRVASDKQPQIASGRHDREISEVDFRYGGPKPRSREAAVLMLCDGVEGAVRALSEPTVGRIESTVQTIVSDRLNDGQFDECDITLREIRLVEESLVKTLCSIYHGRVAYPKASKAEEESQEPKRLSV